MNKQTISFHEFFYENIEEKHLFEVADKMPYNLHFERPGIIEVLPELQNKDVLDAGCATGWYSNYLYKNGARVTALDISENMIKACKKRMGDRVRTIQCDLSEGTPFLDDESFDIVLSSLTLDYIEDWDTIMSEFQRVLRTRGVLIFSVQHPFDSFGLSHMESYFKTICMAHPCNGFGKSAYVQYFKRPIEDIFMPVIRSGFSIELVREPRPKVEFADTYPDLYRELQNRPEYIIIKAVRK